MWKMKCVLSALVLLLAADAVGQAVLAKLTPVYRAGKKLEAVAVIRATTAQVSAAVQELGTEILVADDVVSTAKEKQTLQSYRKAHELYDASLADLQASETWEASTRKSASESDTIGVGLRFQKFADALQSVKVQWDAAKGQLVIANAMYLGKPIPKAIGAKPPSPSPSDKQ
jgi:hypothetical protein